MQGTYDDIRKAVLDAALPDIAFDGWSEDVLARAGTAAGIDDGLLHLAFAGGVRNLIEAFSKSGDAAMLAARAPHERGSGFNTASSTRASTRGPPTPTTA